MGASEFQVFSKGEVGRMHVLAHRLTDEGQYALGHRFLGDWLEGQRGAWTASRRPPARRRSCCVEILGDRDRYLVSVPVYRHQIDTCVDCR